MWQFALKRTAGLLPVLFVAVYVVLVRRYTHSLNPVMEKQRAS